ncbi:hypothetical protein [Bdellovibrio sp. KM01]|uniref:hypothetical protein n=1 Tax=Bdellovibrio sp. KM01 TaxID=2748865 RepID=UPI0015EA6166|nr:hypothetical protein [Bdellovibrio sp. KM01]QLY26510.1 hypothetical protein HW988_05675 [Bdellovibrio sp. KM01]
MKKLILMIAMTVSSSAFAAPSTPEFIDTLVDTINARLVVINNERAQDGAKLYCKQLNADQVNLIAAYFRNKKANTWKNLGSVNASSFVSSVGFNLSCFPKPCKNYDDLVHGICNAKSYKMDRALLTNSLEAIKGGKVYVNTTMDEVAR